MGRTHGAGVRRVRLWRWRRNPLRRRSDLVEAWALLAALVLALAVAVAAALAAAGAVDGSLAERRDRARAVAAVLLEDAAHATPASVSEDGDGDVWAPVRWTAPDGTRHTGRAEAGPGAEAGTEVTVWTDPGGRQVSRPPDGAEARFQVAMAGVTVGAATAGLGLLGTRLVLSGLQRRRLREWEAEWRLVEPSWRRRMTG